jgi:hypothetical protein
MRPIGFSTGALALGDFRKALKLMAGTNSTTVELSALRDHELRPLMSALRMLDLSAFAYVSIHVPSKFKSLPEAEVAAGLLPCIDLNIPLVIHPDAIRQPSCWAPFGRLLCIENMDKRKNTGRTPAELDSFFDIFRDATFCLDLAHAHQVDSTMTEARLMLTRFGARLRQVHISEIDAEGHHERLSLSSVLANQSVAPLIPINTPIIIESMISKNNMEREMATAQRALMVAPLESPAREYQDWGELA